MNPPPCQQSFRGQPRFLPLPNQNGVLQPHFWKCWRRSRWGLGTFMATRHIGSLNFHTHLTWDSPSYSLRSDVKGESELLSSLKLQRPPFILPHECGISGSHWVHRKCVYGVFPDALSQKDKVLALCGLQISMGIEGGHTIFLHSWYHWTLVYHGKAISDAPRLPSVFPLCGSPGALEEDIAWGYGSKPIPYLHCSLGQYLEWWNEPDRNFPPSSVGEGLW